MRDGQTDEDVPISWGTKKKKIVGVVGLTPPKSRVTLLRRRNPLHISKLRSEGVPTTGDGVGWLEMEWLIIPLGEFVRSAKSGRIVKVFQV